jgi:hypothetical protein
MNCHEGMDEPLESEAIAIRGESCGARYQACACPGPVSGLPPASGAVDFWRLQSGYDQWNAAFSV